MWRVAEALAWSVRSVSAELKACDAARFLANSDWGRTTRAARDTWACAEASGARDVSSSYRSAWTEITGRCNTMFEERLRTLAGVTEGAP